MSHRDFLHDPHGLTDEARQGLLDNRCEKGPKRHRTKGRTLRRSAAKKRRTLHVLAIQRAQRTRFLDAVRAFWSGHEGCHP